MDPLSQAVLGASATQSIATQKTIVAATILGLLSGMAPDLDTFIRSSSDPLLFLEYHRQFTHSLIFIPLGALICAAILHPIIGKRRGLKFTQTLLFCILGYATHALLDSCTNYGTQLLWPFTDQRLAWNTISIIDPLFTLPILGLIILATRKKTPILGRIALAWAITYPTIGLIQKDRAEQLGWEIAKERGHKPIKLEAKPSFGNLLVWKTVYETEDRFYVDAARVGYQGKTFKGDSVEKLVIERDLPWLNLDSQQAKDIERFRWFSNNYIAKDPNIPNRIIDIRYSMVPNQINALWSLELSPKALVDQHAKYIISRERSDSQLRIFKNMLF
jgi:inner membrane protein